MDKSIKITHSAAETQQLAGNLAKKLLKSGGLVALYGDLGAGKTIFTQGFAQALGIRDRIISPTFIVLRQYSIPQSQQTLFHFDLYRLETLTDLQDIGFPEIVHNPNNLVVIEWAEKADQFLPKHTIKIKIEKLAGDSRKISISRNLKTI